MYFNRDTLTRIEGSTVAASNQSVLIQQMLEKFKRDCEMLHYLIKLVCI